jgi:hypothetical protein
MMPKDRHNLTLFQSKVNERLTAKKNDLREIQELLPSLLDAQSAFAQITRARYLELVKEGFSKEEALILCK